MKPPFFLNILLVLISPFTVAQDSYEPSFEDILSLQYASNPQIAPNGNYVVYQVRSTDWDNNRFDNELWIANTQVEPFQLTNSPEGNSSSPKWSPDSKWIGFLSSRAGKNQLFVIRPNGGEAQQITQSEQGVSNFEWSPDGSTIAYISTKKNTEKDKTSKLYGDFAEDETDGSTNQLWTVNFNLLIDGSPKTPTKLKDSTYLKQLEPKLHLEDQSFFINNVLWSPDGSKIAIEHQPNSIITSFFEANISIYDVDNESITSLINNPSYDGLLAWSPTGDAVLYESNVSDTDSNFYTNSRYFIIDIDTSKITEIASEFDENISNVRWHEQGIFGLALQKTRNHLVQINPLNGKVSIKNLPHQRLYSFSMGTSSLAFSAAEDDSLTEIYTSTIDLRVIKAVSNVSKQLTNWMVADSEVISWKSKDGTIIEGVLHKPKDFDPNKRYPLMVVIHGGPTGISMPTPVPPYVYPIVQWLNKGALVLRPNYRGSAGYGEKFRALNVRNLGVGDAWDVISGVKYLEKEGFIDITKVASMGWSQGGYISAYLTTNSNLFKAISVGAGISNWMTYYVNTDIHPFTRQYLKATPWSDENIYKKTSPMTNINKATTPTLIQHGEFDTRVPTANAYELYQGLKDRNVPSKLIIYKGFGHGITKPKERLAATWHNWQWINQYIWGETIELPKE